MDFLDPKKRRANEIRLLIGYALIAVGLILAGFIVFLRVSGFDIDRKTGEVIQKGLVFVDSHPVSSGIYLNGQLLSERTNTKLELPGGQYDLELRQDGYRSWFHSVEVEGGGVVRLAYPLLFPNNLETSDVQQFNSAPGLSTSSPDRQWLLVQRPGSNTTFDSFNLLDNQRPVATVEIPQSILNQASGAHSFSLTEWSTDNRHVLLRHNFKGGNEFIMVDREQPSNSFNLNALMGASPTSVSLRDKKFDRFYVYFAGTKLLQTFDTRNRQLQPLIADVITYKSHGDDVVLYTTPSTEQSKATTVKLKEGDQTYTLHTYNNRAGFLLDIARFDRAWYAVITSQSEDMTYIYRNPQAAIKASPDGTTTPLTALRLEDPKFLSFSEIARFISIQNGPNFSVYDIETNSQFSFKLDKKITASQQAKWMDGHRLTLVIGDKSFVTDFDGTNQQTLSDARPGTQLFFDRDYEALFTIAPSTADAKKLALTRTELIVER